MFEQSGTFKGEFIKLGIPAEDYDIQDNFGQTDHRIDLFGEIEKAYGGGISIFNSMNYDDLIIAFFPCVYFETIQQLVFALSLRQDLALPVPARVDKAIRRLEKRTRYHCLLYQLYGVCYGRGLRLVIENPATVPNYLISGQNFPPPTIVDKDRTMRGDVFRKPTAYWFVNCEPTGLVTGQGNNERRRITSARKAPEPGLCSEERSMISPDYARNFIHDFILGKPQNGTQLALFE